MPGSKFNNTRVNGNELRVATSQTAKSLGTALASNAKLLI
jgi:hypothetical protein